MQIPFRWAALRGRYYVHLVQMHGPFPNSVRVGGPLFAGLSQSLGNEVASIKYLGVIVNERLSFTQHANHRGLEINAVPAQPTD